jgi:hypothetical protein
VHLPQHLFFQLGYSARKLSRQKQTEGVPQTEIKRPLWREVSFEGTGFQAIGSLMHLAHSMPKNT